MLRGKGKAHKNKILILAKYLLAFFLLYYLITSDKLNFTNIGKLFRLDGIIWLFLPFILLGVSQVTASRRLSYIINSQGGKLTTMEALRLNIIGLFFNNCLPGNAGGDIVKSYYVYRDIHNGIKYVGIVFIDRFFGFLGLISLVIISQLIILTQIDFFYTQHLWMILFWTTIIVITGFFLIIFVILRNNKVENYTRNKLNKFNLGKKVLLLLKGIKSFSITKKEICYILFLSIVSHVVSIAGVFTIGMRLSTQYIDKSICLIPITLLAGFLPITPGGLGWTEYFGNVAYSTFNLTHGADIFLSWRIITILFSLGGLILYLFDKRNRELN